MINERRRRKPKKRVFGCSFNEWWAGTGRYKQGSKKRKLSVMHEELEAWDMGEKLGIRLGVRLSRKVFDRCRTRALLTYGRDCR